MRSNLSSESPENGLADQAMIVSGSPTRTLNRPQNLTIADERDLRREELIDALHVFGSLGFGEGAAGHITVRDPGEPDQFWVNPFGIAFSEIRIDDLVLVDHQGAVVEGTNAVNRAAFAIHSQIHKARPDVISAAHSHSTYGRAFSTLGVPLEPITQDSCAFFEDHGIYTDYSGIANVEDEAVAIATALGTTKAAILQNHGLITVGTSVPEAAWWFITMERSCQVQLAAMSAGTPRTIAPQAARKVRDLTGAHEAGWFQYHAMHRRWN